MLGTTLFAAAVTIAGCAAQTNDWLIVPGKRAGPITASTTRVDLVRLFGAANVTEGETTIGDAGPMPCTKVFAKKPDSSLTIVWEENKRNKQIAAIEFCQDSTDSNCRWRIADGVGFGTTLKTLEKMNGRPFKILGFGWDFSGQISSWEDGRLQAWQTPCGNVALSLNPTEAATASPAYASVTGDRVLLSSNPSLQKLDPGISRIEFSFGEQKGCR
jgi:hypothetical protein